ncbi:PAS domain-containing protein [Nocardioides sp. SOB44]|jgi:PAS domain S-box-containing protein|uniref:histidine kinase n=1 Tax=Nocardioides cremeus TaxID=3058044 RepID=A0ABT8TLA2_9ACTN|nr:PAS domain-containing protein [Nocardioides cremeus]MDO3394731.1 PAS domain-containing protein [Nocardioides cremeus]
MTTDEQVTALQEQLARQSAARHLAEQQLADLAARVDNAQRLATMGDYDWHVASDTNTWSDELFRIYGYEPGAIEPSYAVFLEHVHPDDRERVTAAHQHAYATGEPYEMVERIVRPDGQVRHLSSNGQVVCDTDGTPLRLRGTCIDITDRVLAEQEREEAARQLGEMHQRRRQASEINDNVVQGLTAALYAGQLGDHERAAEYVQQTLAAACRMMTELMDAPGADDPALVRSRAAEVGGSPTGAATQPA